MTLLFIPFPIEAAWQPVEHGVDSVVELIDQLDGQNNFVPGKQSGENVVGKIANAFGRN